MSKKNKKLCKEAKNYLEAIRKNKYGKYCLTVEMESYTDLGCLLSALFHISQQSLFLKEEKVEEDIRIDIYNLLDFANKLIPFPELELLDEIKNISR
ncbi:hypothetical protein [uncultured Apibacter sp.]|uniref:hypothetical protein n=1 Tax=uncultured Apibacter sp. TaxID=1778616 RepID=UPI0025DC2173|nr:hypothetical protein [uncultured Apibacter sp.]